MQPTMKEEALQTLTSARRMSRRALAGTLLAAVTGLVAVPVGWRVYEQVSNHESQPAASDLVVDDQNLMPGATLQRDQQYGEAASAFSNAIKAEPNSAQAYVLRGMAEFNGGQTQASIADFTRAIKRDPNNAVVYLYRGQSYQALGDTDQAARDFQTAVERAGDNASLAAAARAKLRLLPSKP